MLECLSVAWRVSVCGGNKCVWVVSDVIVCDQHMGMRMTCLRYDSV